jgi:nitroreductase
MAKDDGSLNLRGAVTPLMRLLLSRRSVRRYREGQASPDQIVRILSCARTFQEHCGFVAPRLLVVGGTERDAVVAAAMKGVIAKINPWLPFAKARHLMLCGAVLSSLEPAARELAIKQAAMTLQVAILAATELGLATCWMAGINHERVEGICALPDGATLIAMSPLGLPTPGKGLSWDAFAYHLVSKRRKPFEALWMAERWRAE